MKIVWTSPADEQFAKRFMSSVMYCANVQGFKYFVANWMSSKQAKILYNELTNLTGEFKTIDIDVCVNTLSEVQIFNEPYARVSRRNSDGIMKVIAWFCQEAELFWDVTNWDQQKLDEVLNSRFGKVLYEYDLLQKNGVSINTQQSTQQTTASSSANPRAGTGIKKGQGRYAQSGPHSDKVSNLIGNPHQKEFLSGEHSSRGRRVSYIQTPVGIKPERVLYIEPIGFSDQTGAAWSAGSYWSEIVRYGRPHYGWACTLYFNTVADAEAFKNSYLAKHGNHDLAVYTKPVDKNGYFKVKTELGEAYIKAERLNEELIPSLAANLSMQINEAEDEDDLEDVDYAVNTAHEDGNITTEEYESLVDEIENKSKDFNLTENIEKNERIGDIKVYDEWLHASIS